MILPDANILLYAEDSLSKHHDIALECWDSALSGSESVNLCWPVLNAYIRIATNPRIYQRPLTPDEAIERVESWFQQPCVRTIGPTENHWKIFQAQITEAGASGNLVADAHLAALAIEHDCVLLSFDQDFSRFPALKWRNPLAKH